jgi:hypothetical protein
MYRYFKIRIDPNSPCGVVALDAEQRDYMNQWLISFLKGEKTREPLPNPLKFTGSVYQPYPERPSHILAGAGVILVSEDFVKVLRGAGVDNFELFPATVEYPKLKKTYTDYYVLNVIGTVDVFCFSEKSTARNKGRNQKRKKPQHGELNLMKFQ